MKHLRQLAKEIENILGTRERLASSTFLKSIIKKAREFGFHSEEALDLAHETLCTLLIKARNQEIQYKASLKTFARGIHRNLCLNRLRQRFSQKHGNGETPDVFDESFHHVQHEAPHYWDPLKILKKKEKRKLVKQWIEMLKQEDYRAVLSLRLKGHDRWEISQALNMPLKRIDEILHYGQKKLADLAKTYHKRAKRFSW